MLARTLCQGVGIVYRSRPRVQTNAGVLLHHCFWEGAGHALHQVRQADVVVIAVQVPATHRRSGNYSHYTGGDALAQHFPARCGAETEHSSALVGATCTVCTVYMQADQHAFDLLNSQSGP